MKIYITFWTFSYSMLTCKCLICWLPQDKTEFENSCYLQHLFIRSLPVPRWGFKWLHKCYLHAKGDWKVKHKCIDYKAKRKHLSIVADVSYIFQFNPDYFKYRSIIYVYNYSIFAFIHTFPYIFIDEEIKSLWHQQQLHLYFANEIYCMYYELIHILLCTF